MGGWFRGFRSGRGWPVGNVGQLLKVLLVRFSKSQQPINKSLYHQSAATAMRSACSVLSPDVWAKRVVWGRRPGLGVYGHHCLSPNPLKKP